MSENRYQKLLAIDTAGKTLRLALSFGEDRLVQSSEVVDRAHGQLLIAKIDHLFTSSGLPKSELQGIVVLTGPGSFTGVRIGLATAKGMAIALNIPVIGISLFEIALFLLGNPTNNCFVVVPFGNQEWVVQNYDNGQAKGDKRVLSVELLSQLAESKELVGISADKEFAWPTFGSEKFVTKEFGPSDLIHLGSGRLSTSGGDDISKLEPMYVLPSTAERNLVSRQNRS